MRARRVWRNNVCAAGARCSPPGSVLIRAHIYGYGRTLRPPQGTSIAPRRRAVFCQTLLTILDPPETADSAVNSRNPALGKISEPMRLGDPTPVPLGQKPRFQLGELLIEKGLIDEAQLGEALVERRQHGGLLGETLVRLGFI